MIVYAQGPKLNNETRMAFHACFYFRGMNSFVSVVLLCVIFYSRFEQFFFA